MANGHINLMVAGLVGAFMTSLYTFRMIFIVFHGKEQIHAHAVKGVTHSLPLIVLLILSTFVGALIVPPLQGRASANDGTGARQHVDPEITSGVVAVVGILLAARLWLGKRTLVTSIANSAPGRLLGTGGTTPGDLTGCMTKCSSSRSGYCPVAETRSAELNDEHPGCPFPLCR